ncbi:HAD-IIIC family phosphatase [Paenibacillus sp. Marseille-Q9583]
MNQDAYTILEILDDHASNRPDQEAYRFLNDDGKVETITYSTLREKCISVAAGLTQLGANKKCVLLCLPPGIDYIIGFFGCLYSGAVAVPLYPPRLNDPSLFNNIVNEVKPSLCLSNSQIINRFARNEKINPLVNWYEINDLHYLANSLGNSLDEASYTVGSTAFIQYTSGSTSNPKGILISHKNILHNSLLITQAFGHSTSSRGVIWLPPYHDMGLIGGIIQPLYAGFPVLLMSPFTFSRNPYTWLESITQYKATTSGAPNFAYDLCLQKISLENREKLDLSSWEVAFAGAENNNPQILRRFASEFRHHGFNEKAFFSCFGLAENTLLVSGTKKNEGLTITSFDKSHLSDNEAVPIDSTRTLDSIELVSCGKPAKGVRMKIINTESRQLCNDNSVGEIWIAGDSVGQGYFQNEDLTKEMFNATFQQGEEENFLRTGDLGFIYNEELYIVGRIKEVMKIRGKNYYPQDFEQASEKAHQSLIKHGCAVFMCEQDKNVCVVQEIHRHNKEDKQVIMDLIYSCISEKTGIRPSIVILVREGSIPKTTSGKIKRNECRNRFLLSSLNVVEQFHYDITTNYIDKADIVNDIEDSGNIGELDNSEILNYIKRSISRVVGGSNDQISGEHLVTFYGVDSLHIAELISNINSKFNLNVTPDAFFNETIQEVAEKICAGNYHKYFRNEQEIGMVENTLEGNISSSLDQNRLWMMQQIAGDSQPYLLKVGLEITGELKPELVELCMSEIVSRHSVLRTTFVMDNASLMQKVERTWNGFYLIENMSEMGNFESILNYLSTAEWSLDNSELFRAYLISNSEDKHHLLFVGHHIIVDLHSLQIVQKEFCELYAGKWIDRNFALAQPKKQFGDYLTWHESELHLKETQLKEFWSEYLKDAKLSFDVLRHEKDNGIVKKGRNITFTIPESTVMGVNNYCKVNNITSFMLFLSSYYICLFKYLKETDITIAVPTLGREHHSFFDAVGFFAHPTLFRAVLSKDDILSSFLTKVRESCLRVYANKLYPYSKTIELYRKNSGLEKFSGYQVMMNYVNNDIDLSIPDASVSEMNFIEYERLLDCDLSLSLFHKNESVRGTILFNDNVIEEKHMHNFVDDFLSLINQFSTNSGMELEGIFNLSASRTGTERLVIGATFTAEPIMQSMQYFNDIYEMPYKIEFTPYNQIFNQLLMPTSSFYENTFINVALVRLEDWYSNHDEISIQDNLSKNTATFLNALKKYNNNHATPLIIFFCPYSGSVLSNQDEYNLLATTEKAIIDDMISCSNLYFTQSIELLELYPIYPYYDKENYLLSSSPYTEDFYTSLGTHLTRKIYSLMNPDRFKVIVVDADQTLWEGICGEESPEKLVISPARVRFHKLLLELRKKGILLCLCSKNNEQDVMEVFKQRKEMLIKPEHFIGMKVNWDSKSDNIQALSKELNLDMSDFIFIDDNPVECAEVKSLSSELITLQFPQLEEEIDAFIKHVWAFDRLKVTREDTRRNEFYKSNLIRKRVEEKAFSFKEFLKDSDIKVTVKNMETKEDIDRVSQLTFRVNQFNFTQMKCSGLELLESKGKASEEIKLIEVTDRFGDYGVVGAIFLEMNNGKLTVKNMLLSCRVLGKTVEYEIIKWIANRALQLGFEQILIKINYSNKNQPAQNFLNQLVTVLSGKRSALGYEMMSKSLKELDYWKLFDNGQGFLNKETHPGTLAENKISKASYEGRYYPNLKKLQENIKEYKQKNREQIQLDNRFVSPRNYLETVFTDIWRDVLGLDRVGVTDNFFEVGGHSLLLTQVMSRFKTVTTIDVPLRIIFAADSTIESWVQAIEVFIAEQENELNTILGELEDISMEELTLLLKELESAES